MDKWKQTFGNCMRFCWWKYLVNSLINKKINLEQNFGCNALVDAKNLFFYCTSSKSISNRFAQVVQESTRRIQYTLWDAQIGVELVKTGWIRVVFAKLFIYSLWSFLVQIQGKWRIFSKMFSSIQPTVEEQRNIFS